MIGSCSIVRFDDGEVGKGGKPERSLSADHISLTLLTVNERETSSERNFFLGEEIRYENPFQFVFLATPYAFVLA